MLSDSFIYFWYINFLCIPISLFASSWISSRKWDSSFICYIYFYFIRIHSPYCFSVMTKLLFLPPNNGLVSLSPQHHRHWWHFDSRCFNWRPCLLGFIICIFFITSDTKHFFLPLTNFVSLEENVFRSFAYVFMRFFILLLPSCLSSLCILDINTLSYISYKYFVSFCLWFLHSEIVSLTVQHLLAFK